MLRMARLTTALAIVMTMGQPLAAAHEPVPESVPSFSESPGCGDLDGVRGPLAAEPGILDLDEPIYGPWGDFYGRTVGLAWAQRVVITLPNMVGTPKTLWVHERVLPALQSAIANLEARDALGNEYPIRYQKTWSWSRYTIPPGRAFSFHAVGAALDINSDTNPYRSDNVLMTDMPDWFVEAWTSAGWCWGGSWQSIKDPMHYSWMGPIHTPGYTMPPPQPPLVAATSFTAEVAYDVGLDPATSPSQNHFVVDVDRDGAVDVVRVEPAGDGLRLIVARARHNFLWSDWFAATPTEVSDAAADIAVADLTRDGRPDLALLLDSGGALALEVFPLVQGGLGGPLAIPTAIPASPGGIYLFDDDDRDGDTDAYVIRPGDPATLEVWRGPGFSSAETVVSLAVPSNGTRFALGDRDFDGRPDLLALRDDGRLSIHSAASGFRSATTIATGIDPTGETLFAEDLDGDGHPDLMLLDDDGQLRMRRGGASSHDPGVWFVSSTHRVERIAGEDRFVTAAATSRAQHPDPASVDTVVIATGAAFPDALAGASLAARIGAPLLLVAPDAIPAATAAELDRLDPVDLIVLGGPAAISESVGAGLEGWGTVLRLAGRDRYETAVEISRHAFPDGADVVVVATGETFADALSAAPAASQSGGPVLLTTAEGLPQTTRDELLRLAPSRVIVLGGEAVVPAAVLAEIETLAPVERAAGHDRYTTAVAASRLAFSRTDRVYVATGMAFPDALAGAAAGAYDGSPILLIPGTSVPDSVIAEIMRLRARTIVVIGGTSVVTPAVESLLAMAGF